MSAELDIALTLVCFVGSAFFAGMETGVLSLNHARLVHLARRGSRSAKILNGYVSDMQSFLTSTLVGNNLMNVALSALSANLAQGFFPSHHMAQTGWAVAMAFTVLFFCEYLPKLFFAARPLRRTLVVARLFHGVRKLLAPLTALVLFMTKWLMPGRRNHADRRFLVTREYIQNVVSDSRDGSRITAVERLMINRVLALHSLTAALVMTPLARVSRTTENAALKECYRQVSDSGHVRLPVFSEDDARCVGVLNALEVLTSARDPEATRARDCMQPPYFVGANLRADDVLPLMRKNRQPVAMVRDAKEGAVLGIITEENILNALTGNLQAVSRA